MLSLDALCHSLSFPLVFSQFSFSFRCLWFAAILLLFYSLCCVVSMCAVSMRCFHARCSSRYLFFSGPPWPLFLSWPSLASDCTSSVSVLLPFDLAPCKFSFVSLFRLRSLSFSSFRLSWLLLISSPLLFPCGGLGLVVPELMVLCCLLSPLLFAQFAGCHFIFACALLGLCDFWRTCSCRSAPFSIRVCSCRYR